MSSDLRLGDLHKIPDPFADLPPGGAGASPPLPPSPSRGEVQRTRLLAALAVVVAEALALVAFRPRPDVLSIVAVGGLVPLLAAAVGFVAARRLPARAGTARTLVGLALPVATFLMTAWLTSRVGGAGAIFDARSTAVCLSLSCAFTVVPILAVAHAYRAAFPGASIARGSAMGLAAGVLGSVVLRAHCPNDALFHLVVAHGAVIVLGILVGALLGRRVLRS